MYVLNFGLVTSYNHYANGRFEQGADIYPPAVVYYLEGLLDDLDNYEINHSCTEPTLVARFSGDFTPERAQFFKLLADIYQQDCIAVWDADNKQGHLIGEHSEDWGEFDPQYFIY